MTSIQNGSTYDNLYARAAAALLGTCAPAPKEKDRLAAYNLITGVYQAVLSDAAAVGFPAAPDCSFAPWEQQRGREKDVKDIRDAIRKVEAMAQKLFDIAETAEEAPFGALLPEGARLDKKLQNALKIAGCPAEKRGARVAIILPEGCFAALQALAAISRAHVIPITDGPMEDKAYLYFSRGVFDPKENWQALAFDRLLNADGRLILLCDALKKRGYQRIDCFDGKRVCVDFVKQYGKKDEPLKQAWAERTHAGLSVSFEELRLEPCFVWLRLPMFKTLLTRAGEMPETAARFIAQNTKTCDGCRYCVQTDKTGERPLAAIKVLGKPKCPMFPGFSFNWRALPPELSEGMLSVLDAVEALLKP